jgi:hypothetical protein
VQCELTHVPEPLQTTPPWSLQAVPRVAFAVPQALAAHVGVAHVVPVAGQSLAITQPTQLPAPSQKWPPPSVHGMPIETGGFDGTPLVHTSIVHCLLSTGRFASSTTILTPPAPSHSAFLQLPIGCVVVGVPFGWNEVPQTPAVHVRDSQSVS